MPLTSIKFSHGASGNSKNHAVCSNSLRPGKTFLDVFGVSARALAITNFSSNGDQERNVLARAPKLAPEAGALPDQSRGVAGEIRMTKQKLSNHSFLSCASWAEEIYLPTKHTKRRENSNAKIAGSCSLGDDRVAFVLVN